jgi:surface antigen
MDGFGTAIPGEIQMRRNALLTILLAGAVAVAATESAFAQAGRALGNAYQNGYNDGYQAGFEAGRASMRGAYGPPPPPAPALSQEDRWEQRYQQTYDYNDDNFYRECRQAVDPGGVIAGALIGGLLGNALSRGRTGGTVAGVVIGGVTGAALTRNLTCEDRSYAYQTYHQGFTAGRPNTRYEWRNPNNGHYGEFLVRDYYNDPDGFRCANYTQQIFINGQPQAASGRACQQPDGTWAIVS